MEETKIVYDFDTLSLQSKVIAVRSLDNKKAVITERTPFHPVSHTWPDQPGDIGTISHNNKEIKVTNTIIGALNTNGDFFFDKDIPVKRTTEEGWKFFVCHVVDSFDDGSLGLEVTLQVDKEYRHKLSLSHSAVHLAVLALNKATKKYWKKEVCCDTIGNPDFDKLAIQESKIYPEKTFDRYRIGKSMKKKGFDRVAFFDDIAVVQEEINEILRGWIGTKGKIENVGETETLRGQRYWVCSLPDGKVRFPCGGTHAKSFGAYKEIHAKLERTQEEFEVIMQTTCVPQQ